jgi:hypothetical protein
MPGRSITRRREKGAIRMNKTDETRGRSANRPEDKGDTSRIVSCEIGPWPKVLGDTLPEVRATFDDGTVRTLFRFYPDELTFDAGEFIGLTAAEATRLWFERDRAFLKS